ncbi:SMI1/KNR4 family protein [Streptomyces spinosirectus]|uniref:SMI1/KNR4 family protein n=2 Tax=Streptomyces TaxID=1883 RepID=UPI001C9D946E|nr:MULTISPECIES: SMI1/KNR4 family protein [Streptomyces]MBY8343530.1 SMI1/KNR4 family protein [Streptomyces plumbidurans]UIR19828.1 SMI1/KNR4 family protein [Streptomyces spinosirectus]
MHPAVERLFELIPPATPLRARDWAAVERQLGTPLPDDYKELVETYGGGVFDETIWLLDPECPDEDYNLRDQAAERTAILADLWQTEARPAELHDPDTQVLPWAYVEESGMYLYWLRKPGQKPNDWTVILNEGRGPEWTHHASPCAAPFLLAVLTGRAESEYFPDLPLDSHSFDSNDDIPLVSATRLRNCTSPPSQRSWDCGSA